MIQGVQPGTVFRLTENRVTTVGRSTRNTIPIVSPSVSRFHCEIASVNGKWQLSDLNSRKGTMVNAQWVTRPVLLRAGDLIRLSSTILRFDLETRSRSRDSALLAIKEAELDTRLRRAEDATGSIEDIIRRSRLESMAERDEDVSVESGLRINFLFLGVVLLLAGGASAGALAWAHSRLPAPNGVDSGNVPANVDVPPDTLPSVEEQLAQLRADARREREQMWDRINVALATTRHCEDNAEYHRAFELYDSLNKLKLDEAAISCIAARRATAEQRARAYFARIVALADQLEKDGDVQKAIEALSDAAERVGIKELADKARKKAQELQN